MRAALLMLMLAVPAGAAELTVSAAINIAKRQNVVIVGEVHDNPIHHFVQREFAAALQPSAIVFEMVAPEQEGDLNRLLQSGASDAELAAALDWAQSGWPPIAHYTQIMRSADAIVYGAAVPRDKAQAAVREGAARVLGDGAVLFGLDQPLPAREQSAREALQDEAHCGALPAEMLPGMVEAQRLRDAALAASVLRALKDTGGTVLVVTGNGHARLDWGAPAAFGHAAPSVTLFTFAQLEAAPTGDIPYDGYHVTLPAERDDPCKAFEKS